MKQVLVTGDVAWHHHLLRLPGAAMAPGAPPPGAGFAAPCRPLLESHVFVRRERAHPDVRDRVLGHAVADTHQRAQVHHRCEHRPIDRELLDLEQDRFTLLRIPQKRNAKSAFGFVRKNCCADPSPAGINPDD